MSDDLVARLRALGGWPSFDDPDQVLSYVVAADEAGAEAAGRIEELTAERDALRGISNDVLWLTRLAVGSSWPGEMVEQVERAAARVRALLDPEDGERELARREDPVHLDAFRQACIDVLGEDPFVPEDGERTTCATCDDSGMVTISGRPEDGPDPCPDCWPEDGDR